MTYYETCNTDRAFHLYCFHLYYGDDAPLCVLAEKPRWKCFGYPKAYAQADDHYLDGPIFLNLANPSQLTVPRAVVHVQQYVI